MLESEWISALGSHAERLQSHAGWDHHMVSPLGAWLVLALCALAADPETRGGLAPAPGGNPDAAADFAAALLDGPHPLGALAVGAWIRPTHETERIRRWQDELPAAFQSGDAPAQEHLDAWTVEHTMG